MDKEITFSAQAVGKMVMHAMKYPHCSCSGFLLSHKNTKDSDEDDIRNIHISQAIPVSHSSYSLAPLFEIAFNSVNKYAEKENLVISGYYHADRFNESAIPDVFSQRIADKINESFPNAVLCYINYDEVIGKSLLDPHQFSDGKWRRKGLESFNLENDIEFLADNILYTKDNLYRLIVDFDDHFNNISLDWTNGKVSDRIERILTDVC